MSSTAGKHPTNRRPGRRAYLVITLVAFALVLMPFLFWYYTWFGRKLSDAEMDAAFADQAHPRRAQHALVQLGERISAGRDVSRWYPNVVGQASSSRLELRETAAWIMGRVPSYAPFQEALRKLAHDPNPMVRRNAALSLAAFGDGEARGELIAMLRPYSIAAPASGVLKYRLKEDDFVNPGTLVARVGATEVRSPVPGAVRSLAQKDGASVKEGDPLIDLAPDKDHVWEALRALYLVGQSEDLEDVERYLRNAPGLPERIARQAALTRQAIEARQPH